VDFTVSGFYCTNRTLPTSHQVSHLITSGASRSDEFSIVALAVQLVCVLAVREVHEQLLARGAREARGVDRHVRAQLAGDHHQVTFLYLSIAHETALKQYNNNNYDNNNNNNTAELRYVEVVRTQKNTST